MGRQVLPRLIECGIQVRALIRNHKHKVIARAMGFETVLGDIFNKDSLHKATIGCDAAIHIATAIPKSGLNDWSLNDRIRREGTQNLLEAATANGVKRYIQQSIALLYGEKGKETINEETPIQTMVITESADDMENFVRRSTLDWCILRGGMFYGPSTGREDEWREAARQRKLKVPGDGSALISLVHVTDMARAVVAATRNATPNSLFNIVDDHPVSYGQLFSYISAQMGTSAPEKGGPQFLPSLGCSNEKAKRELGWQPLYPSYLSGLA